MWGWSISASACRSASNRAMTCRESIPALISLTATRRLTGSVCCAIQTVPMPPSPISSSSLYRPARVGAFGKLALVGSDDLQVGRQERLHAVAQVWSVGAGPVQEDRPLVGG